MQGLDLGRLADGSNIPQINNGDIEPLAVPLPPQEEQLRMVAAIDRLMRLLVTARARMLQVAGSLNGLELACLGKAFKGDLVEKLEGGL
jgi:type I restriction enzyme S subunit